jgi:hypothetical protein
MSNQIKDALSAGQSIIENSSPKFLPALNIASVVTGLAVNVIMLVVGVRQLNDTTVDKTDVQDSTEVSD